MKDAAGNTPAKRTKFEKKWIESIESGDLQKRYDTLQNRLSLPLKDKIALTEERVREWHEAWSGNVAVSYSGGIDSAVLLHLTRKIYPDVEAVFCNTGLEYPEIIRLVKKTPNVRILRPKKPFHHIIRDYGWPIASKKVARGVSILRNPTDKNQNITRLYDQGINRYGEPVAGYKIPNRWRFLVDAPFDCSDKCCAIMKKDPMNRYTKETGNMQFVGMMASDSKQRQKTYLQHGCNAFDSANPKSTPIGFWKKQDVLLAVKMLNIPYAEVYGEIIRDAATGELKTTGVSSTGCIFCAFGLHMEGTPNRFQQLYASHPKLWKFCMEKLGLKKVLQHCRDTCPDRSIRPQFNPVPVPPAHQQRSLF